MPRDQVEHSQQRIRSRGQTIMRYPFLADWPENFSKGANTEERAPKKPQFDCGADNYGQNKGFPGI